MFKEFFEIKRVPFIINIFLTKILKIVALQEKFVHFALEGKALAEWHKFPSCMWTTLHEKLSPAEKKESSFSQKVPQPRPWRDPELFFQRPHLAKRKTSPMSPLKKDVLLALAPTSKFLWSAGTKTPKILPVFLEGLKMSSYSGPELQSQFQTDFQQKCSHPLKPPLRQNMAIQTQHGLLAPAAQPCCLVSQQWMPGEQRNIWLTAWNAHSDSVFLTVSRLLH